jgi:hypothetical protein
MLPMVAFLAAIFGVVVAGLVRSQRTELMLGAMLIGLSVLIRHERVAPRGGVTVLAQPTAVRESRESLRKAGKGGVPTTAAAIRGATCGDTTRLRVIRDGQASQSGRIMRFTARR